MPALFSPLAFAGLRLRNRVAMPPMWSGKATAEGFVTPAIVDYHRARAAAGTALIIVEHACVHPQGRHSSTQLGAHDDACVSGLSTLAAAIRAEGAVACLQISHAGARAASRVTAAHLVAAGAALIDVSGGLAGSDDPGRGPGYFVGYAEALRENVDVPVLVAGGIADPRMADLIIRSRRAGSVGIGRAMLDDPAWTPAAAVALDQT